MSQGEGGGPIPRVLTNEEMAQVEALAAYLNNDQIADYLGIGRTTLHEIMKRQPEVSEHYKRGKAKAIGSIAQSLVQKARDGDTTSAIFYLKTQAGWKETIVHENPDDNNFADKPWELDRGPSGEEAV
jgi:IS30 family transposase